MRTQLTVVIVILHVACTVVHAQVDKRPPRERFKLADGAPEQLRAVIDAQADKDFIKRSIVKAAAEVRVCQQAISRAKSSRAKQNEVGELTERLRVATAYLEGLKKGTVLAWPSYDVQDPLKVGTAGYWGVGGAPHKIIQVIDAKTALVKIDDGWNKPVLVYIEKIDTTGWIDGMEIRNDRWLLVYTGTKTYKAVLGTNTVFVAQPFSETDFVYLPPR
ncbi:MAG TPA: hypothetical protein VF595_06165 [Tepidisphaeraceae bacterium]|jgi:hypothetical protein